MTRIWPVGYRGDRTRLNQALINHAWSCTGHGDEYGGPDRKRKRPDDGADDDSEDPPGSSPGDKDFLMSELYKVLESTHASIATLKRSRMK